MTTDGELLRRYAQTRSEDAFAELVQRHVNLVYSAALRQVNGDPYLAQDVAQTVFTDLARKAASLSRRATLTGWLYTSAHFAAAKIVRGENRRRDREEKFMREPTNESVPEGGHVIPGAPDWENLRPMLDKVMHQLKEVDREAILLRYFENRPFAEIGGKLGLNENAARMRVERALDKLRAAFLRRGVAATAALASVISANAVQIAPAGLAATLTTASLAGAGTGTFTLLKFMTLTKLKLGLSVLVVAGATTTLVVQHQTQSKLRAENESLTQQIAQLKTDNESFSNRLAATSGSKPLPEYQLNELLRLRGEVGTLRRQINELGKLQEENQRLDTLMREIQNTPTEVFRFNLHRTDINRALNEIGAVMEVDASLKEGPYPTNLDQLAQERNGVTNFPGNVKLDDFELVNAGLVNVAMTDKLFLREKKPRQFPDGYDKKWMVGGKWERFYVFADGHAELQTSDDGNFDAWEQQHMVLPLANQ